MCRIPKKWLVLGWCLGLIACLEAPAESAQAWIGDLERVQTWQAPTPAARIRLSLTRDGLYGVSAQELAQAGGWSEDTVAAALASGNLRLSQRETQVPYTVIDHQMIFYGTQAVTLEAPESVYWVSLTNGLQCTTAMPDANLPRDSTNTWFKATKLHHPPTYESRLLYGTLTNFSYVTSSAIILAGKKFTFKTELPQAREVDGEGEITLRLHSLYEGLANNRANKNVSVTIANTAAGTVHWQGEKLIEATFSLPLSALSQEEVSSELYNLGNEEGWWSGNDSSRFLLASASVTYPRSYQVFDDQLACRDNHAAVNRAYGFSSDDIVIFDTTAPLQPQIIPPLECTYDPLTATYAATWPAGEQRAASYSVATTDGGLLKPSIRGVSTKLGPGQVMPRLAIIIPAEGWVTGFRAALEPLAALRRAQGITTQIFDVEEIYNHFSDGFVSPQALQDFCAAGYAHGLRYVLLVGSGSLDYKHQVRSFNDYTCCLIPTFTRGQTFQLTGEGMVVALDALIGDADGDGRPEIAVGRFPSSNLTEIQTMVHKTLAYEYHQRWRRPPFVSADWDDPGKPTYAFHDNAHLVVATMQASGRLPHVHTLESQNDGVRIRDDHLFPELKNGLSFFYFLGHTNEQGLTNSSSPNNRLLYINDFKSANWHVPPIAVIMGCRPNRWQGMTHTDLIMPYGLRVANTGFVAGIGSTGNMDGQDAAKISLALFNSEQAKPRRRRLGDMLLFAHRTLHGQILREHLLSCSLVGDPTLTTGINQATTFLIF